MFSLFPIAGLLLCSSCFILNWIILRQKRNNTLLTWALFNFAVAWWGLCSFFIGIGSSYKEVLTIWRISHFGITLIPVFLLHNTLLICEIKRTKILKFAYIQALFFLVLVVHPLFIKELYEINQLLYIKAGPLYYLYFTSWTFLVVYSFRELFLKYRNSVGLKKNQIKYLFLGFCLGFSGGITNFLPVFQVPIYPFGNLTIPFYCLIVTYAIIRYRLLDITVAVTRTGIFILVYSVVLGIPFAMAFAGRDFLMNIMGEVWWMVPLMSSTVLATSGPFIYSFVQQRAEDRLLQEQRRYQHTLRQASSGMSRIKDLKKLLNLIVHVVTRTVRLEHSAIYLFDEKNQQYILGAFREKTFGISPKSVIRHDSILVKTLMRLQEPLLYEEIKQRMKDYADDLAITELESYLRELKAAAVIPSFIEDRLLGILILGMKRSGQLYSEDDLGVFSILANQAALAIENAQFYEDMKKTHAQLLKTEKMATIGTMADGLSHQINNRLHALAFIASDVLDTIKIKKDSHNPSDLGDLIMEVERGLQKVLENVNRGHEIVDGLLKYTRKGSEAFEAVDLNKLLDASLEMAQFKVRLDQIKVTRKYPLDIPRIRGNFTQLQEVFFNLIDNAYDAMMQKKEEFSGEGYVPTLYISAVPVNGYLKVDMKDNGIGVRLEDQDKLFTPFFTTKFSASKKGTGLGLYVIKKLIEDNHNGKITFYSDYLKGTSFSFRLPIAK